MENQLAEIFNSELTDAQVYTLLRVIYASVRNVDVENDVFPSQEEFNACLQNPSRMYSEFSIPKKSGGERRISAPTPQLKTFQRAIASILSLFETEDEAAHGFIPGRSVGSNARMHLESRFVLNVDLKDFFPSVTFGRVKYLLQKDPFLFSESLAHRIARLCCLEGALPQGSPASPILTNIVCRRMDKRLGLLAASRDLKYTRYADDITFSGEKIKLGGKFFFKMEKIIQAEKFKLNLSKTRLLGPSMRKEVTGITVNEFPNVSREYLKELRAMLYNWESKGLEFCQAKFKENSGQGGKTFKNVVRGKIAYLKMIRGDEDPLVIEYFERFNRLARG